MDRKALICVVISLFILVNSEIQNVIQEEDTFKVCFDKVRVPTVCFSADSMKSAAENITERYNSIDISNNSIPILRKGYLVNIGSIENIFIENCNISLMEPGAFENLMYRVITLDRNNLTRIDYGVFTGHERIHSLYIKSNLIEFIDKDAFANMSNLQVINLSENRLKYWNPDWFVTNWMAVIHFGNNLLEELPDSAFAYPNVAPLILNFANNKIKRLSNDTFKGALAVNTLSLVSNQLTDFREEWLQDKFVYRLEISDNKIECLPYNFTNIVQVCTIFNNNPYSCPCVERLREYARKKGKCYQDNFEDYCE